MSASMATTNGFDPSGDLEKKDKLSMETVKEVVAISSSEAQPEESERKARVDAVWEQMNKGVSVKVLKNNKPSSTVNRTSHKTSTGWMTYLGLGPKKRGSLQQGVQQKESAITQNGTNDEAKRLAAAALSAVKDAAAAASGRGKVEIVEVRDFAGEEIEVKKLVDAASKEASEKAKGPAGTTSAVDAILEQIKKKPKLSVLDKTKMDWGGFKEDNKGLEEELDAYKKSSNQYLDKVSFLQRADYREFERERDARLALHARRRPDMSEDP
ncbi:craniofacial development protein 1 isoform X1 [Vitis riparia]|uniref:craniofacial development protein 1 isoform X1 n=2 Tax=Vitis riparia TaxID=96939 RepID=UPI00155A18F9|nr:craniofacial development protein 1 isoform X1 [Vitis riparia]